MSLQSLLKNPMIEKLALKQVKKAFTEEGIKGIVIFMNESGEIDAKILKENYKVLTEKDYLQVLKIIKNLSGEPETKEVNNLLPNKIEKQ